MVTVDEARVRHDDRRGRVVTDAIILHDEWEPLIATVVNSWVRRYPMIERDDLWQELMLWWYSKQQVVAKALEPEGKKDKGRNIGRRLNDIANAYCRKEKASRSGYRPEDEAFYTPTMLRELLPFVFSYDYWTDPPQRDGERRGTKLASEGNEYLAQLCDISFSFEMLPADAQALLRAHFYEGYSLRELAGRYREPYTTVTSRIDRALRRMTDILGGVRPRPTEGPGTRHVMTNAAAQSQTTREAEGQ
jgi:hypothetical protein